jgi:hypothetical protein
MKRIDRLPLRQRVILVIATAAVLLVGGGWVTDRGPGGSGWFGYAPLPQGVVTPGSMSRGDATLFYLGLIVVWTTVSLLLLRAGAPPRSGEPLPPETSPDP